MVSFFNLPSYIEDEEIIHKLNSFGVTPILPVRRRYHPGTTVADGTRFLRVRFPKEVASLPYTTKFMTEEGAQYFRVIHDNQRKTCRICTSTEHELKDCPQFLCRNCLEQGHYARDCTAPRCQGCNRAMIRCRCETDEEENKEMDMEIQEEMGGTQTETSNQLSEQTEGGDDKQNYVEEGEYNLEENAVRSGTKACVTEMDKEPEENDKVDYQKTHGKERTEDNKTKTQYEVRETGNGEKNIETEDKIKERLNRVKSVIDIEKVLKKQKIRREERNEMMEKRRAETSGSTFVVSEETELD
ncbi:ATP-dependent RNA helicase glh-4 [Labeo rohita]|uniref:ATP-dependent RNA helicase glh-4 n=1 Tax=Labeo rohita TaxID=84645 RepID=A0ABQ8L2W0_LABRO|nr:ATP-dependent RNA helicase glh-4 [Labeo rohita]